MSSEQQRPASRRSFLKGAAATAGLLASGRGARAAAVPPSERITLGFIGVGGHGRHYNLKHFLNLPEARVLAVCDVFPDRREAARSDVNSKYGNQDCETIADFRELIARDDLDAVVISTPDHWHVLMSLMAARAGRDVFCEKPTLTIDEGRVLSDYFARTDRVYQGGIEDRSVKVYHRMAEIVRNGGIGKLDRVEITLPEGTVFPREEPAPVPDGLDYDLWLGPAPFSPYTPTKLGPQEWRNDFDYSGGKFTDWGAHLIDTAHVAMMQTRGGAIEVEGTGEFPVGAMSNTATKYDFRYTYPGGAEMTVRSGGTGIRFIGSDGWVGNSAWREPLEASSPDILNAQWPQDANLMEPIPAGEHQAFIDGVRSRKPPYYTPEDIHRLSIAMHIGNISMRLGRKLKWDADREEFPGDAEADSMRGRPMREPWSLDEFRS